MNEESYSTEIVSLLFFKIYIFQIHDIFFKNIFNTKKLKQYKIIIVFKTQRGGLVNNHTQAHLVWSDLINMYGGIK